MYMLSSITCDASFDFTSYACLQHAPTNYFFPRRLSNSVSAASHCRSCDLLLFWHCTMCDAIRVCFAAYIADDLKWSLNFSCFHQYASHAMTLERLLPLLQWHKEIYGICELTLFFPSGIVVDALCSMILHAWVTLSAQINECQKLESMAYSQCSH